MITLYKRTNDKLQCVLCPHFCSLAKGKTGICGVRKNTGEKIELTTYGVLSGFALDPLEKKPLYHYYPGYNILSIGSFGCNMHCDFCQNYHISQKIPKSLVPGMTLKSILNESMIAEKNIGLAFTYNEPIIWFEFMRDAAMMVKNEGLHTVLVSNGFVNKDPLVEIIEFIDAFNIDLKAFNNNFYRKITGAELEPVKNSLKQIAASGKHLEITTLIIPGLNDDAKEMALQAEWIAGELGKEIPLHLSKYYPTYKRDNPPTAEGTLNKLFEIASEKLDYVYTGNTHMDPKQNTYCSECNALVTTRSGFETKTLNINKEGKCTCCGNLIYRYFTLS
jgi:pyruvate formate lyase activating enzyme